MKLALLLFISFCFLPLRDAVTAETVTTDFAEMPEAKIVKTLDDFPAYDSRVAFVSSDGSALISAFSKRGSQGPEMEIFRWSIADEKIVQSVSVPGRGLSEASLSANGRVLVIGFINDGVLAWDMKGDKTIALRPHEKFLGHITVSSDGKKIATEGVLDKIVKETSLSVKQGHPSRTVLKLEPRSQCSSLVYSPDGRFLAGGIIPGTVIVWDAETLEKKWEQKAHSKAVQIVFAPDSQKIITVEFNVKIVLWDAPTGTEQVTMKSNDFPFQYACVSSTGKLMATMGFDRESEKQTVVVWNLASRKGILRYTLTEEQQFPTPSPNMPKPGSIAFLPNESGLVIFGKKPFVIGLAP